MPETHRFRKPTKDRVNLTTKKNRVDPSILSGLITTGERNNRRELLLWGDNLEIA